MAPANPVKRKQVIVDRGIQYRFARFVMLFAIGTAVFTSATVFFTTFSLLGDKLAEVYPQGRLVEIFRMVYLAFAVNLVVVTPLIFWVSIRFSHHTVGPLPKIYETLRKVGRGDLSQSLTLRKTDELHDLATVINEMIANLKNAQQNR